MTFSHTIDFAFDLALDAAVAIDFVHDVRGSLKHADFIRDLRVQSGSPALVEATIPVNAALFGQRQLPFRSQLVRTPKGALLKSLALPDTKPGWAEVAGEAAVTSGMQGSLVTYRFAIAIHLDLPAPEKWGGRALTKMIEYTATSVLARVTGQFPDAVQRAATAGCALSDRASC